METKGPDTPEGGDPEREPEGAAEPRAESAEEPASSEVKPEPLAKPEVVIAPVSPLRRARAALQAVWDRTSFLRLWLVARHAWMRRLLARIDPNDDPDAEPLMLTPLLALAVSLAVSVWMYWHWKFQPMQDMGHHVGLSAVVADYDRPGSLYPALYDRPDPFYANSFLYTVAGHLGRHIGVTRAVRVCMVFYVAGVPLANLYALRVFGRSAWPSLLAVPLVYNMNYTAGFSNLLFAAPFLVLSVPFFYRALLRPTWSRVLVASLNFVFVFLSHAHIYLWCGALAIALTLGLFLWAMVRPEFFRAPPRAGAAVKVRGPVKERLVMGGRIAGISLLTVLPSLAVFFRWYQFAFGEGATKGSVTAVTSGLDNDFGAYFKPTSALFHDLWTYAAKTTVNDDDLVLLYKLCFLVAGALVLARLHSWKRPPVLEIAWVLTFVSYFYLPEAIDTNPVVGSRQIGVSMWFVAALACPVPARVSRIARWAIVLGTMWFTREALTVWFANLVEFERTEAHGLEFVLEPAPYRKTLHMVKVMPDTSKVFQWKPNWHVDKYYMADRLGQVADNPAIVSTSSIRYKEGVDPHRITWHSPDWPRMAEIWENEELILVHGWNPTPQQMDAARDHAVRLRKEGDWELWRRKGEWQEKGDGPPPDVP